VSEVERELLELGVTGWSLTELPPREPNDSTTSAFKKSDEELRKALPESDQSFEH